MPKLSVVFTLVFLFFSSIRAQQADTVSFIPHWLPQSQFAGYYAAYENGIYKKYGIEVKLITGGPQNSSDQALISNKTDFASLWLTNALQLREQGHKIVNIAQIIRRSAFMLVAKKSSGIQKPKDMDGKKAGLWQGFTTQPLQFFKQQNINVKPVIVGGTINLFLRGGVDITSVMRYNEYHQILNSGLDEEELVTFPLADYGLNFPEEGIYVNEEFLNNNRELCRRFVKASIEGWLWCFQNEDKALEIVTKYMKTANLPVNKAHQRWMLSSFKDLMLNDKGEIDTQLPEFDFNLAVKSLIENGVIQNQHSYNQFFKSTEPGK